ncbi:MAG: methylmalonyl Co-A mutase-associated GTPase MeaB [Proteobacteria bacterium]|nr:methylmalonyl Co-A mutase-associated GTPase MeaB [Pseudomonadota bacterium]
MKSPVPVDFSAVLARNRLALARAISLIENGRDGAEELHARLLPHCGHAHIVGITGAPGAGKSTLINALLVELLRRGHRIAVVAVDPSSPISGGAILGDRVRMVDHGSSDDVFIRSVSSRGHLGGLSRTTGKLIDVFDAAGFDIVIVETVGTGQSEVEISRYADTRIVVCPPGLGDEVQSIKAGILEIADILVVNKGDLPQAQRVQLDLQALQELRHPATSGWRVPVLCTVASSGKGVIELIASFEEHARIAGIGQRLKTIERQAPPSNVDFGEFACDLALGVTLGHSLEAGGRKFKKGRVLDAVDIGVLQQAGIKTVSGARLEDSDATEDAAAAEVAALLAGLNCETRKPYTGRCNLHARERGLFQIDAAAIARLNRIDEAITVGTLPPWTLVRKGQVIATVKIVPLGVNRRVLDEARAAVAARPLSVAELVPHRAALILSELPGIKESAFAATIAVTRQRLDALGSRLALELRCPHRQDSLEDSIRQALAAGCDLILISGATVTKDRRDVAPAAIVAAGGRIVRFGMPVEPGNMLLLAYIDAVPVIVLPGCARSRRLNGLDWVLHRLLAKLPLGADDIAAMGVGGLIRSAPEDGSEAEPETPAPISSQEPAGPRIAALVLAAGRSSRMGGSNKMLARVDGIPLALRARNAALASRAVSVTVVTGFEAEAVETLVAGPHVSIVRNPDFAQGMAGSLRRGIASLPTDIDGVVVLLADMPRIDASHIDALIDTYVSGSSIVVPMHSGQRGNPILWPRRYFEEMQGVEGDKGARELLRRYADEIITVEISDDAIFTDVDAPEDLR